MYKNKMDDTNVHARIHMQACTYASTCTFTRATDCSVSCSLKFLAISNIRLNLIFVAAYTVG